MPQLDSVLAGNSTRSPFTAGGLSLLNIFRLPLVWLERAHFRARLREDLKHEPGLLRDVGIDVCDAQAEAARFFWEPVLLEND